MVGKEQDPFDGRIVPIDAQDFLCEGALPGRIGHGIADTFPEAAGKGLRDEDASPQAEVLHHLCGGWAVHKGKGRVLVKPVEIGIGQVGGLSFDRGHEKGVPGDTKNSRFLCDLLVEGIGEGLRAIGGKTGGRLDVDVGRQVLVDPEVEGFFEGGNHDHDSHDHAKAGHDPGDRDSRSARGGRKGGEGEGGNGGGESLRDSSKKGGEGRKKRRDEEASRKDGQEGGCVSAPRKAMDGRKPAGPKGQESKKDKEAPESFLAKVCSHLLFVSGESENRWNGRRLPDRGIDGQKGDSQREQDRQKIFGKGERRGEKVGRKEHGGDGPGDGPKRHRGQGLPPEYPEKAPQNTEPSPFKDKKEADFPGGHSQKAQGGDFGASTNDEEKESVGDQKVGHQEGHQREGREVRAVGREHGVVLALSLLPRENPHLLSQGALEVFRESRDKPRGGLDLSWAVPEKVDPGDLAFLPEQGLGPGEVDEEGVSGKHPAAERFGDFPQDLEGNGGRSVGHREGLSHFEVPKVEGVGRKIDTPGGGEDLACIFSRGTVRAFEEVEPLQEECLPFGPAFGDILPPRLNNDRQLQKGGDPEGSGAQRLLDMVDRSVGKKDARRGDQREDRRVPHMVDRVFEGEKGASVGLHDGQDDRRTQRDPEEGKRCGQGRPAEVAKGVLQEKQKRRHRSGGGGDESPVPEMEDPVSPPGGFNAVGAHDDRRAELLVQELHEVEHPLARQMVEGSGGLVGQQKPGAVHQCPGDCHSLLFASRELRGKLVALALQSHLPKKGENALPVVLSIESGRKRHVVEGREEGEEVVILKDKTHVPATDQSLCLVVLDSPGEFVQKKLPAVEGVDAGQDIQQGRLSGSGVPHDDHPLALPDVEGEFGEDRLDGGTRASVGLAETPCAKGDPHQVVPGP